MTSNRKRQGRNRGQAGFTLVELMISMVIISVGLFAIIHLQVVTVRGHRYAWELSEATWLAVGISEDLRIRSTQWVKLSNGYEKLLGDALGPNSPYLISSPNPSSGDRFVVDNLRSVSAYKNVELSSGPMLQNSELINVWGQQGQPGGIYRAHYVAFFPYLKPTDAFPNNRVVQTYLDITWDSKDHGESYDWVKWSEPGTYFKRHFFRIPLNLRRTRYY